LHAHKADFLSRPVFQSAPRHQFDADEIWSRGISAEVATEVRRRCDLEMSEVPRRYPGLHGNA